MNPRELSVVTTLYNSFDYIEEFIERVVTVTEKLRLETEIILVNDGSPDNSLSKAIQMQQKFNNIKIVDLSRNFGHTAARLSGLRHATKNEIFLIDVDLEESPEWLDEFFRKKDEIEADVVYGVQTKRKGTFFERVTGYLFYRLVNIGADVAVPINPVTARLMNRNYLNSLLEFNETNPFLAGIWALTGYKQAPIFVQKGYRGATNYKGKEKFKIALRDIVSYSTLPLKAIFGFSQFFFITGIIGTCYLIIKSMTSSSFAPGWLTTLLAVWFFAAIQIFCLGIIGVYLAQISLEVKNRPQSFIKRTYE